MNRRQAIMPSTPMSNTLALQKVPVNQVDTFIQQWLYDRR